MTDADADTLRQQQLERWERAAAGWAKRSADNREHGRPVSIWMIQQLELHPGQRVLELAAGPGDTGLLAAELIRQPDDSGAARACEAGRRAGRVPEGTLVSSDATAAMLEIARERARQMGVETSSSRS